MENVVLIHCNKPTADTSEENSGQENSKNREFKMSQIISKGKESKELNTRDINMHMLLSSEFQKQTLLPVKYTKPEKASSCP